MRRVRRGQNTVEMALMLPLLVLLIAVAIDFARVFYLAAVVANSARVAAEYAATSEFVPTTAAIKQKAVDEGKTLFGPGAVTVEPATWDSSPPGQGAPLKVTVTVRFQPILRLPASIATYLPNWTNVDVSTSSRMRRNCWDANSDGLADCPDLAPLP
jgi:Flp pilus assembly protein TadG